MTSSLLILTHKKLKLTDACVVEGADKEEHKTITINKCERNSSLYFCEYFVRIPKRAIAVVCVNKLGMGI